MIWANVYYHFNPLSDLNFLTKKFRNLKYFLSKISNKLKFFFLNFFLDSSISLSVWSHDTRHNNTQHNDSQNNDTEHNDTQHNNKKKMTLRLGTLSTTIRKYNTQNNNAQHNSTQYRVLLTKLSLGWVSFVLSVAFYIFMMSARAPSWNQILNTSFSS